MPNVHPAQLLSIVKLRVLRPPNGTVDGAKLLVKPGRSAATVRSAVAGPLLPALEVRSPETFMYVAATLAVTFTTIVQVWNAPTIPSARVIVPPPSGAVCVPRQELETKAGAASVTPDGRVSLNANWLAGALDSALLIVKVSALTLPEPMVAGVKAFEKLGVMSPANAAVVGATTARTRRASDRRLRRS